MATPAPEELRIIEEYLAAHDPAALKSKVADYAVKSRKPRSREQIRKEIYIVLKAPGGNHFVIPQSGHPILADTPLFRARIIDDAADIAEEKDVWHAPSHYVGPGRLNTAGESLLYTAVGVPRTAAFEVRAKAGDLVAMTEYKVTSQFNALRIGDEFLPDGLSLKGRHKLGIIMKFLEDIFTQRSIPEETHKYIAPELVTKDLWDLPASEFQAWSYTSLADPSGTGWNLCFRPALAQNLLAYVKTDIVKIVADPADGDDTFKHEVIKTLAKDPASGQLVQA